MNYIGAGQHGGNTLRNGHDDGRTKGMTISRADTVRMMACILRSPACK